MKSRGISIRSKITRFFLVACVLPIIAFLLLITSVFIREANNLIRANMQVSQDDLNGQIQGRINRVEMLFNLLYTNESLMEIIEQSVLKEMRVSYRDELFMRDFTSSLLYTIPIQGIDRIIFVDRNNNISTFFNSGTSSLLNDSLPLAEMIRDAESKSGGIVYSRAYTIVNTLRQEEIIHGVSRTLRNISISLADPFKSVGTFILIVNRNFFLVNPISADADIRIAILDQAQNIVVATDPTDLQSDHAKARQLQNRNNTKDGVTILPIGYVVGGGAIRGFNYMALYYKPIGGVIGNVSANIAIMLFLLLVFCVFLLLFLYRLLSRLIIKPLGHLSTGIKRLAQGDLSVRLIPSSSDELGRIMLGFNGMANDIDQSIQRRSEMERQLRREEIRYLQAQLNPHFLFNTLSMARILSMNVESGHTPVILQRLTRLLRAIINQMGQEITIEQEIANLEDYIGIQSMKYPDRFSVDIGVAETAKGCLIPSLTIQPLLENAILHGILPRKRKGHIGISIDNAAGWLVIIIEDNGVGMSVEQIDKLSHTDPLNRHRSIGYYNVHRILQLRYGNESGLSVDSQPDSFTRVTIHLPAKQKDQYDKSDQISE